jgi:excisionase family DNA binding protein
MQEILMTTVQVARYLRIDKITVYRLVTQRKIPAFKVGNQWRFKKKIIDAWLLKNSNLGETNGSPLELNDDYRIRTGIIAKGDDWHGREKKNS